MSAASKAAFARSYWDCATRFGLANSTTTFHTQYNKHDYSYDGVRQDGQRGLALGYLTKVRFTRFLQTREGEQLTGVDCSRPGGDAKREERARVIANQFFEMLVRYSQTHPHHEGDYDNVARSRNMQQGSFCVFTGFSEALASDDMAELRKQWKERYAPASQLSVQRQFLEKTLEECVAQYLHVREAETVSGCQNYTDHAQFVVQCKRPSRHSNAPRTTVFFRGILKKQWKFQPLTTESDLRRHFGNAIAALRL